MRDLRKIKIWHVMYGSNHFWITTIVLYLNQLRGLPLDSALQLMSFYYLFTVLLEYPTGVIGDYFSHRISVLAGVSIGALGIALFSLSGGFIYYLCINFIIALGISLVSGSDTALLHSISSDFKKDYSQIRPYMLILSAINIAIGGFLGSINLTYPFIFSGFYAALSLLFLLKLGSYTYTRKEANIFKEAGGGFSDLFKNKILFQSSIISIVITSFFLSIKWFYNPIFEEAQIPTSAWGIIIGIATLAVALGAKIYQRSEHRKASLFTLILILVGIVLTGSTSVIFLPIIGIWVSELSKGYFTTNLDVVINKYITTDRRASILSLNSLASRLGSFGYVAIVGAAAATQSFFSIMVFTALAMGLITVPLVRKLHAK